MTRLLVPFTDPEGAERSIRKLLPERGGEPLEVELLAIAEAPHLSRGRLYLSRAREEDAARATAACWLARLAPLLENAGVPYTTRIVIGEPPAQIEAALHRTDVDRVLLPATAPRWPAAEKPVTVVN
jgi:hypothetical protein